MYSREERAKQSKARYVWEREREQHVIFLLKKIYYLKGEILQEYGSHLAARGQASIKARGFAKYARKL